jgi:hypothetical protein
VCHSPEPQRPTQPSDCASAGIGEGTFESGFVVAVSREFDPQGRVVMNDAAQFGSYGLFEQTGASVKVADGVAIGYNHRASLVVFAKRD